MTISKIDVGKAVNKGKECLVNLADNLKGKLNNFNKVIRNFEIPMPKIVSIDIFLEYCGKLKMLY